VEKAPEAECVQQAKQQKIFKVPKQIDKNQKATEDKEPPDK